MSLRRFTRLTKPFSTKLVNLEAAAMRPAGPRVATSGMIGRHATPIGGASDMLRKILAVGLLVLAATIIVLGNLIEYGASQAEERLLEPGVVFAEALIISSVLFLASHVLWPK